MQVWTWGVEEVDGSVGYAFINFIDPLSIIPFAKARVGTKWSSPAAFPRHLPRPLIPPSAISLFISTLFAIELHVRH
jgi:hypothetical protein